MHEGDGRVQFCQGWLEGRAERVGCYFDMQRDGECNLAYAKGDAPMYASLMQTQVAVKWLQVVLVVNAAIIMAMFAWQARQRRVTRWSKAVK
jgi:hypothetical protein